MTRDELILEWRKAAEALSAAKAIESELRMQIAKEAFNFDENKLESGTENLELGNGYKLKCEKKLNYYLAKDGIEDALEAIEATGAEGEFIADRLVRFKPELSVSEYKKLNEKYKKIIDKVLTTKAATPTITLIEPKVK